MSNKIQQDLVQEIMQKAREEMQSFFSRLLERVAANWKGAVSEVRLSADEMHQIDGCHQYLKEEFDKLGLYMYHSTQEGKLSIHPSVSTQIQFSMSNTLN